MKWLFKTVAEPKWFKLSQQKHHIIQRIVNICEVRSISTDEILDIASSIADIANESGRGAMMFVCDQRSKVTLIQENEALKKQISLLEDQVHILAENVDISDLTGEHNE